MSSSHPVQTETQFQAHRREKLKACERHLKSIVDALAECEVRISNADRPAALRDPVFANSLPKLYETRDELTKRRAAAEKKIADEFGDILAEPAAPRKDVRDQLIDDLQTANAGLVERLKRCTCGRSAS